MSAPYQPARPVTLDGLGWSDGNRRAHTTHRDVAIAAARALKAADYTLAYAERLERGIYRFVYENPALKLRATGAPLTVATVELIVLLERRSPLPAQIAYRLPGETDWRIPRDIGGEDNYYGDEDQAQDYGRDLASLVLPDSAEIRVWPVLLDD